MSEQEAKFDIRAMLPIGMTFVVTGIGIAYGLDVMGDIRDDIADDQTLTASCNHSGNGGTGSVYTGCGAAYNGTADAIEGVSKIPSKMPMLATIVVAAIVIGILVRYLVTRA